MRKAIGLIGVLLVAYVAVYYALVNPLEPSYFSGGSFTPLPRDASYRIGGKFAESAFRPLESADRRIRPQYWTFTVEDYGNELGLDPVTGHKMRRPSGWR
ncbi:MAG: hypothetical protein WD648_09155 [Planctomycetaceae bacterium]